MCQGLNQNNTHTLILDTAIPHWRYTSPCSFSDIRSLSTTIRSKTLPIQESQESDVYQWSPALWGGLLTSIIAFLRDSRDRFRPRARPLERSHAPFLGQRDLDFDLFSHDYNAAIAVFLRRFSLLPPGRSPACQGLVWLHHELGRGDRRRQ